MSINFDESLFRQSHASVPGVPGTSRYVNSLSRCLGPWIPRNHASSARQINNQSTYEPPQPMKGISKLMPPQAQAHQRLALEMTAYIPPTLWS